MFHHNLLSLNPNSCVPALVLSLMALACAPADHDSELSAGMSTVDQEGDPNSVFPTPDAGPPEGVGGDDQAGEDLQSEAGNGVVLLPVKVNQ